MRTHLAFALALLAPLACVPWARLDLDDFRADAAAVADAVTPPDAPAPDGAPLGPDAPTVDASVVALEAAATPDAGPDEARVDASVPPADVADVPSDAADASPSTDDGPAVVDVPAPDVPPSCGPLEGLCGGACTALLLNPEHCGACGRACPGGDHATASCNGGRCELVCEAGYIDCGGGCQDARTDLANCGACSRTCPGARHALPACEAGRCAIECAGGYTDCDGDAANGCETPFEEDALNCGGCGRRCGAGQTCSGGACRD